MIKLVKNKGQVKELTGKSKYLFKAKDRDYGTMYAIPGLKTLLTYLWGQIRYGGHYF